MADESTSIAAANHLAVSFVMGSLFSVEWKDALARHSLKSFHACNEKRTDIQMDLAKIIRSAPLLGVCFAVDTEAYRNLAESDKKLIQHEPKPFAFYKTLKTLVDREDMNDNEIGVICDDDQEYSMECYKLLNKAKVQDARIKDKIFSLCFADDEKYLPLQAADMLTNLTRKELVRRCNSPSEPPSEVYTFLTSPPSNGYKARHTGGVYTSESLRELVGRLRNKV